MPRKKENPIRKTTGKGGNYRKTKSGAGMTKKGVAAARMPSGVSHIAHVRLDK